MQPPIVKAPGIYFGMSEEEYHADPSIGSTDLKHLLVSPLTYQQNSWMNPGHKKKQTPAMTLGDAYHARLLEGEDVFRSKYRAKYSDAHLPSPITVFTAVENFAREKGIDIPIDAINAWEQRGGGKPDNIIKKQLKLAYEEQHAGKTELSQERFDQVMTAGNIADGTVYKAALTGGYPEVSIFWVDEFGINCKCRIDYLKVRAGIDLKTFSNDRDLHVTEAVAQAFMYRKYNVQARHYLEGIEAAKKLSCNLLWGDVAGPAESKTVEIDDFMEIFRASPRHDFFFIFEETGPVPNIIMRQFSEHDAEGVVYRYWENAEEQIKRAKNTLLLWSADTEDGKPWHPEISPKPFDDADFAAWFLDN